MVIIQILKLRQKKIYVYKKRPYWSNIDCMSCGNEQEIDNISFVRGWIRVSLYACKACRWIKFEVVPYNLSATIG